MFKFNFAGENTATAETESEKLPVQWAKAEIIKPDDVNIRDLCENFNISEIMCESVNIKYLNSGEVVSKIQSSEAFSCIKQAEDSHSDLITGVYEGGLKIWECTYDLINLIIKEGLCFPNKKVLDLGCGAGLVGIFTLLHGAAVDFQDYNYEVLKHVTIPNVYLNVDAQKLEHCKFFSGDWESFLELTFREYENEYDKFDYIFTSETIYNPENYNKLCKVFKSRLRHDGIVYLAAKSHYFGVGGNIRQFESVLQENNLSSSVCWKCTKGVQREILKIKLT